MTLQCNKCGFKSPQGSEFCGSCGEETEFRVEKRARNAAEAAAAARERWEASLQAEAAAEAEAARSRQIEENIDLGGFE